MDKNIMLEILKKDGCTTAEAEKHLNRGSIIYEDLEENFNIYMDEWGISGDDRADYENMVKNKVAAPDWGIVFYNDRYYYISYCL